MIHYDKKESATAFSQKPAEANRYPKGIGMNHRHSVHITAKRCILGRNLCGAMALILGRRPS
jgi:hypothetical protein